MNSTFIINIDSFQCQIAKDIFIDETFMESVPSWRNLLRTSIFYDNVVTTAPYTIVSDNSFISGQYPCEHRQTSWLNESFISMNPCTYTLTKFFKDKDFRTIYLTDNLSRAEVIPWEFDIYRGISLDGLADLLKTETLHYPNLFGFLKFNSIHDSVCSKSGAITLKEYIKVCKQTIFDLEPILSILIKNRCNLFITTDHGIMVSDQPRGPYIEKITGNAIVDYTASVFFIAHQYHNDSMSKRGATTNHELLSNCELAYLLLKTIEPEANISNLPFKKPDEKKRIYTIGGGLHQSPFKPTNFALTTPNFRYILSVSHLFLKSTSVVSVYNRKKDKIQATNLYHTLSPNNREVIAKCLHSYRNKYSNKNKSNDAKSFFSFLSCYQASSRDVKKIIYMTLLQKGPTFVRIFISRTKYRLKNLLQSGQHF